MEGVAEAPPPVAEVGRNYEAVGGVVKVRCKEVAIKGFPEYAVTRWYTTSKGW
jgi:hypothetical protein